MRKIQKLTLSERSDALRSAILRRSPDIARDRLAYICGNVNSRRPYFIKCVSTSNRFLNMVTREIIVTEDFNSISEIIPLYGHFQCPFFEKTATTRRCIPGHMERDDPSAALKIRTARENGVLSVSYFIIIYEPSTESMKQRKGIK